MSFTEEGMRQLTIAWTNPYLCFDDLANQIWRGLRLPVLSLLKHNKIIDFKLGEEIIKSAHK